MSYMSVPSAVILRNVTRSPLTTSAVAVRREVQVRREVAVSVAAVLVVVAQAHGSDTSLTIL